MKLKNALMVVAMLLLTATAQAATKSIEVEFEYSEPAQAFNLYMNGSKICNVTTPNVMNCADIEMPYGVHQFTMTAVVNGLETQHSPPYIWSYAPEPGDPPVFINFNISVDGKNIKLAPTPVN